MKLYIEAKSRKEVNEKLKKGELVMGVEYNRRNENYETIHNLRDCKGGMPVMFFLMMNDGEPIPRAYGTWNKEKNKIV